MGGGSGGGEHRARRRALRRRLATAALAVVTACAAPEPPAPPPAPAPAPSPPPACARIVSIAIHKSERRLVARCARGAEVSLTVALGREPRGPKRAAGDLRTPEGRYRVSGEPRESRFHLFIPIDYPSLEEAHGALQEGRIGPGDLERIAAAHAQGETPPADTPLGGDIGLHGEGERWQGDSHHLDWTYGCFATTDEGIEFLAERVRRGTPVEIHP